MLNPNSFNDVTNGSDNAGAAGSSLSDQAASRWFDDYIGALSAPYRTDNNGQLAEQESHENTVPGASWASLSPENSILGSDSSTSREIPIPGSTESASRDIPTPGSSSTFSREIPTPGSLSSFPSEFLNVDASELFNVEKAKNSNSYEQDKADLEPVRRSPKGFYVNSHKMNEDLSDKEIQKIKAAAKHFPSTDKTVPGFKDPLDLRDIPKDQLKPNSDDSPFVDAKLLKERAKRFPSEGKNSSSDDLSMKKELNSDAVQRKLDMNSKKKAEETKDTLLEEKQRFLDKNLNSEAPKKYKKDTVDANQIETSNVKPKPLTKPESLKPEISVQKPEYRKPESMKPGIEEAQERMRSGGRGSESQSERAPKPQMFDTADGAEQAVELTGLAGKGEQLTAQLNGQKEFVAVSKDGTKIVQRPDGTVILNSAEGQTKVSTDGVVTVTANGIERQFDFAGASRIEKHPTDGSTSYHLQDGTTVTQLRQNGKDRGLMIKQPNGTTIETSFAQPTQPRYRGRN